MVQKKNSVVPNGLDKDQWQCMIMESSSHLESSNISLYIITSGIIPNSYPQLQGRIVKNEYLVEILNSNANEGKLRYGMFVKVDNGAREHGRINGRDVFTKINNIYHTYQK